MSVFVYVCVCVCVRVHIGLMHNGLIRTPAALPDSNENIVSYEKGTADAHASISHRTAQHHTKHSLQYSIWELNALLIQDWTETMSAGWCDFWSSKQNELEMSHVLSSAALPQNLHIKSSSDYTVFFSSVQIHVATAWFVSEEHTAVFHSCIYSVTLLGRHLHQLVNANIESANRVAANQCITACRTWSSSSVLVQIKHQNEEKKWLWPWN